LQIHIHFLRIRITMASRMPEQGIFQIFICKQRGLP
jgi:hypothetical protein